MRAKKLGRHHLLVGMMMEWGYMVELMFYEDVQPLNREEHKDWVFKPVENFKFAASVNSVPLSGIEFFEASRNLPVLFGQDGAGNFFPLALLSIAANQNDQVNKEGVWEQGYIPAFIRRYPFAMTEDGTVCFDAVSGCLSKETKTKKGDSLFDEAGKETGALQEIIAFLHQYDIATQETGKFCQALKDKDILKPFTIQILSDDHAPHRMEGLYVIDEEAFSKLDEKTVHEWFQSGWLSWIYAHLHSLATFSFFSKNKK